MNEVALELIPEQPGRAFHGSKEHSSSDRADVLKGRVQVNQRRTQARGGLEQHPEELRLYSAALGSH